MNRVIVTGFRAFPGVPDNPSERLVEHLARNPALLPEGARCELLDVEYASVGGEIARLLAATPAALVLTGYSRRATAITLETCASGICAPDLPDAAGVTNPVAGDARMRATAVDCGMLLERLAAQDIPASLSDDAGQYLCNYSYRLALDAIAASGTATQALFVHIPAIEGGPIPEECAGTLPLDTLARGIGTIARALA